METWLDTTGKRQSVKHWRDTATRMGVDGRGLLPDNLLCALLPARLDAGGAAASEPSGAAPAEKRSRTS